MQGDSRLGVYRKGQEVYLSEPQQVEGHWNMPVQMVGGPNAGEDLEERAMVVEVEVAPGDVILIGEKLGRKGSGRPSWWVGGWVGNL